eukprot:TRINITY_DN1293_c0_g1_i3.p1 TRINITY_DN1293_c0_g1~~TRINITY_DN1293_c0_g1_i3.p1  ORF type:complete len:106 (+),score=14.94 TRINITY_DN1293_c0_g1_i3:60-377(+)
MTEDKTSVHSKILDKIQDAKGKELDLSWHDIDDKIVPALCNALECDTRVTWLHLGSNHITDKSVGEIARLLESNSTLNLLYLGGMSLFLLEKSSACAAYFLFFFR